MDEIHLQSTRSRRLGVHDITFLMERWYVIPAVYRINLFHQKQRVYLVDTSGLRCALKQEVEKFKYLSVLNLLIWEEFRAAWENLFRLLRISL